MITSSVAGRVATLTLARPPVNAVSLQWVEHFTAALDELAERKDWHVLHLRSAQKVFCAGADLAEIQQYFGAADGPERMVAHVAALQRLNARIERLSQVSLAEIGGAAMGGGLELALACDLRIVANEARLGLPEVRLGLLPAAGGTQRLARLCGRAVASRLILGAEAVDGSTAAALGIAHWSVPRAELPQRAAAIVAGLAELPAEALAACKACVAASDEPGRGGYLDELEHTRGLVATAETQRRVAAFLAGKLS